jgi:hypothetical protein
MSTPLLGSIAAGAVASPPRASVALGAAILGVTLLGAASQSAFRALALAPGHSILGSHFVWNVFTSNFLEASWLRALLSAALVVGIGRKAEAPAGPHSPAAVLSTAVIALTLAGFSMMANGMFTFMSTASEAAL